MLNNKSNTIVIYPPSPLRGSYGVRIVPKTPSDSAECSMILTMFKQNPRNEMILNKCIYRIKSILISSLTSNEVGAVATALLCHRLINYQTYVFIY